MTQKVKAPNSGGNSKGFLIGIVAIIVIAVVVGGIFVKKSQDEQAPGANMPQAEVGFDVSVENSAVVAASSKLEDDAPTVEIYQDFSCPHCAELAKADHEDLLKALNDGKIKVEYRILNFLDQGQAGSSTRSGAAALALAEQGNAKGFWNLQQYMFDNQADVARSWDNEDLASAVSAYTEDSAVVDSVKNGDAEKPAGEIYQANNDKLSKEEGQVSTPRVFVDGKEIELKSNPETGGIASWVPDVVK